MSRQQETRGKRKQPYWDGQSICEGVGVGPSLEDGGPEEWGREKPKYLWVQQGRSQAVARPPCREENVWCVLRVRDGPQDPRWTGRARAPAEQIV